MVPAIARFADALRREGVSLSPAELIDAARAVESVGLETRARFRIALAATMAKDPRARAVFDRVFDAYFTPPPRAVRAGGERGRGGDAGDPRRGAGSGRSGLGSPHRRRETADDSRRSSAEAVRTVARFGSRSEAGRSSVRRALEMMRARGPGTTTGRPSAAGGVVPRVAERAGGSRADPLRRDLSGSLTEADERALARLVPKLIDALRLREGRRMRASRRGRLWPRRLFRRSLASGGVPFVLPMRRPRPRPTRVVLLVDVSWSVARAAGYFLWMASSFLEPGRRARVVAFVDRPVDATDAIRRWSRAGRFPRFPTGAATRRRRRPSTGVVRAAGTFTEVLDSLPGLNLDAPSDYGRALHGLLRSHLRPTGRDTVLVVLGDARTNVFDPLSWTLDEIGKRTRAILWLVPEPASRWGTGDSALGAYLEHVDVVVEAADLDGLARGVARLLRWL